MLRIAVDVDAIAVAVGELGPALAQTVGAPLRVFALDLLTAAAELGVIADVATLAVAIDHAGWTYVGLASAHARTAGLAVAGVAAGTTVVRIGAHVRALAVAHDRSGRALIAWLVGIVAVAVAVAVAVTITITVAIAVAITVTVTVTVTVTIAVPVPRVANRLGALSTFGSGRTRFAAGAVATSGKRQAQCQSPSSRVHAPILARYRARVCLLKAACVSPVGPRLCPGAFTMFRATLCTAAAALVLLGCAPYVPPPEDPEPEDGAVRAERDCLAGETRACENLIWHYDSVGNHERVAALRLHLCTTDELDVCYMLGQIEDEAGRPEAARARFEETCARGHADSCDWLLQTDASAVVEHTLNQHLGLWRCARLVEHVYDARHVAIWGTLVTDTEAGGATKLAIATMPNRAILQACVERALASTTFATPPAPYAVEYVLDLRPETVAAKLAELAPEQLAPMELPIDALHPDPCPSHLGERCKSLPIDVIMRNAVYAPDATRLSSIASAAKVTLAFCVEPDTGKLSRIRSLHPRPGDLRVEQLILTVSRWRFLPLVVNGKRTLACSRVDFGFARDVQREEPSGPAKEPLSVRPAQAIYTPAPSRKELRRAALRNPEDAPKGRYVFSEISFCIDTRGRVSNVKSRRHDRLFDLIVRDTVKTWRFRPLLIGGEPHESCTRQTFRILIR
jgi:hypothetical protein